ncbi:MAG: gamma-glutamyl-phosphate reductase, partial [Deltaproteobacteria bacterium CG_4_10_14_0_2_um_filter_43_8]
MKTLEQQAKAAKSTVSDVAALSLKKRNEVLALMAKTLKQNQHKIITENKKDLQAGEKANIGNALLDRLMLNEKRIEEMVEGIHTVIKLPDPLAEVLDTWKLKSGVKVKKVRVPLGVIGIIYEARPNVTVDAAALCFKSGNAVLLRGSSSAFHSNKALENCLQSALQEAGVSKNAIQVLDDV